MDPKKVAYRLVLAGALAMGACGDDGGMTVEMDGGADPTPLPLDANDGDNYFMAASTVGIALPSGTTSEGFNLDDLVSDGNEDYDCEAVDYTSASGETGIDNGFGTFLTNLLMSGFVTDYIVDYAAEYFPGRDFGTDPFVPEDLNTIVQQFIATGDQIILFEVKGADSTEDTDVTFNILIGQLPDGATLSTDADGKITAGQTFDIDSDSFSDGTAGTTAVISFDARIVGGQLQIGPLDIDPAAFGLDIASLLAGISEGLADADIDIQLVDAQVTADFTTTGLENGRIGGTIDLGELRHAMCLTGLYGTDAADEDYQADCGTITPPAESAFDANTSTLASLVITFLESSADVRDTVSPFEPAIADFGCERLSLGLTFEAVPATRGTIVDDNEVAAAGE